MNVLDVPESGLVGHSFACPLRDMMGKESASETCLEACLRPASMSQSGRTFDLAIKAEWGLIDTYLSLQQ